mgnify:CR=1 FL=1
MKQNMRRLLVLVVLGVVFPGGAGCASDPAEEATFPWTPFLEPTEIGRAHV